MTNETPKKSRAEYMRNWRKANPDKWSAIQMRYLTKKYAAMTEDKQVPAPADELQDIHKA